MKERQEEVSETKNMEILRQLYIDIGAKQDNFELHSALKPLTIPSSDEDLDKNIRTPRQMKAMLKEIALLAGSQQPTMVIVFIIALLRFSIPFIVRWWQYGSSIPNFTWNSWTVSVLEILICLLSVVLNYIFVFGGHLDFKRRVMMLKACGVMLDPIKENYEPIYRQIPTINLVSRHNLYIWFQMRACLMDLGRKYVDRIFLYSSTFLGCYLFFLVLILLKFFGFVDINLSPFSITIAMFDIFFVLGVNLAMLHSGAEVNQQYLVDAFKLIQIKENIIYLKIHLDIVLSDSKKQAKALEIPCLRILQRLLALEMKAKGLTKDEMKEFLETLVEEIDTIRERLVEDSTSRPLRLLGLTASFDLMNQIYTTIATLGLAVAQQLMGST